jgi:hypothetical protein
MYNCKKPENAEKIIHNQVREIKKKNLNKEKLKKRTFFFCFHG